MKRRITALLTALLLLTAFSGCGTGPGSAPEGPEVEPGDIPLAPLPQTEPGPETVTDQPPQTAEEPRWLDELETSVPEDLLLAVPPAQEELPARSLQAAEAAGQNRDVVGWLTVPGTGIDEAVVQTGDNAHYLRRDLAGNTSFDGSYFADYRCILGHSLRDELSFNTVIYGNSAGEDPDGTRFSQLKRYHDPAFAAEHPTLYLSTLQDDIAWEVFAVVSCDEGTAPFNLPDLDGNECAGLLEWLLSESEHDFGVAVGPQDRILTLVTTSHADPDNQNARFLVAARMTAGA